MSLTLEVSPSGLKKHDFAWTRYAFSVPAGTPFQALLIPETWANVAGLLRVGDTIDCMASDGSYDADLRVVSKGDLYVKMRVLRYWDVNDEAEQEVPELTSEGYEVTWGGPNGKWRVIGPTKDVVPSLTGFTSKEDAEAAMRDYLVKRAA